MKIVVCIKQVPDTAEVKLDPKTGTLIRDGFDNIITAGRSASAEGYGWDILRVIPPAILTGQAAGAAASQAVETGEAIFAIDVEKLQTRLADENVMIHFDDSLIPESEK